MLSHGKENVPMSAPAKLRALLRRPLISGLLIVVPLGITVFVLKFLYDFTAGRLSPLIRRVLNPMPEFYDSTAQSISPLARKVIDLVPDYAAPAMSVFLLFALVYLAGMIASAVVGRRLIGLGEAIIERIPLVKSVYGASKQVVESLSFEKQGSEPKTAAVIEFPCSGMKCIGFVTGKMRLQDGRVFYRVFVPTTPNITVGLFQLVAPEDVYKCDLPVDEAVKIVVSGGILGPNRLKLTRASHAPFEAAAADHDADDTEDSIEETDEA